MDITDKNKTFNPKKTLCSQKEMSGLWNKKDTKSNNNIYTTFMRKEENHHRLKIIDMGVFCIINDITPDMLQMGVRHIKEVASLFTDKKTELHNKIVVMTEEDYKEYEEFKKFQAFSRTKK